MLGKFSFIIDSGFLRKFAIVAFAFVLSSCAYTRNIAPWSLWPGDWGKNASDNPTALIMDIKERGVYTRQVTQEDNKKRMLLCAEPSPDALSATSGAGNAGYGGATLGVQVATTAAYVGLRTQTIQLLRDAMYRLCEATLNEQISKAEYRFLFENLEDDMITLLAIEQLTGVVRAPPVTIYGEIETTSKPATEADPKQPTIKTKGGGMVGTMIRVESFNDKTAGVISDAVIKILNSRLSRKLIGKLHRRLAVLREDSQEKKIKIMSLEKNIARLMASIKTTNKEIEKIKNEIAMLEEGKSFFSPITELVFSETEKIKGKREALEKEEEELAGFKEQKKNLLDQKMNLEKEWEKLKSRITQLEERISKLPLEEVVK